MKYTSEPCVLVASTGGRRNWYVPNEAFLEDFILNLDEPIHKYTCAADISKLGERRIRAEDVSAGAWLDRYDPSCKECITEDSILLGHYGIVLSLLWVDEAI